MLGINALFSPGKNDLILECGMTLAGLVRVILYVTLIAY